MPALLLLIGFVAVHVARDPNRLLDTAYVAAVCALGYLEG